MNVLRQVWQRILPKSGSMARGFYRSLYLVECRQLRISSQKTWDDRKRRSVEAKMVKDHLRAESVW